MITIDGDIRYIDVVLSMEDMLTLKCGEQALYKILKSRGMEFSGEKVLSHLGTLEIINIHKGVSVTYRQTIDDVCGDTND